MRSTLLLNGRAIKRSKEKVHVNTDPVVCLGKIHGHRTSTQR